MAGKRERLRAGEVVEVKPGVKGRLNFQDQTLELSNGHKLPISEEDKKHLFPENEEIRKYAEQKESIQRGIQGRPAGEFLHQLGQKGLIGAGKNWIDKFSNSPEEYSRKKRAEQEIGEEIYEESPWTSHAATAASFIPDIAITRGMSAFRAAPLLAGLHAGPRILEEPGQVAAEAAISAAGGKILDIGGKYLNNVAARRRAIRQVPAMQAETRAQNAIGHQAVEEANLGAIQAHNVLTDRIKNENAALLHQHNLELNARKNRMIEAQNKFQTEKGLTAAENRRLQDEYTLAKKHYEESLKDQPRLQREAQAEYSKNVVKNAEEIERLFPKDSKMVGNQIGVDEFVDDYINSTGLAGSKGANQASKFLKTLFPENEFITAKELSKRYRAIEDAIQRSNPEMQTILNNFKSHLGQRLPAILEDTIAYSKIVPTLSKNIEKDIGSVIREIPFGKGEETTKNLLIKRAEINLKEILKEIGPNDFVKRLESGEIVQTLKNKLLTTEDFLTDAGFSNFSALRKQGLYDLASREINNKHSYFVNEIEKRINNIVAKNELKAWEAGKRASDKIRGNIKQTYGIEKPLEPPVAPSAPVEAPQPIVPGIPPEPPAPSYNTLPSEPITQRFLAQPEPFLGGAENTADTIGDFLERPIMRGNTTNKLLKLGALKYALGPAALPLEAAALGGYGAMKALTSPGALGEASRLTFKQVGIRAIEQMAQRYPSYKNGILENPQERRSLTKEIEDDQEIPIEQKAVIQSKVNRGKPLDQRL